MSTYTEYRVTCNYMHYTQTLAASSQLADILDVYNTLATKKSKLAMYPKSDHNSRDAQC